MNCKRCQRLTDEIEQLIDENALLRIEGQEMARVLDIFARGFNWNTHPITHEWVGDVDPMLAARSVLANLRGNKNPRKEAPQDGV